MLGTNRAISVAALLPALTGAVSAGTTPEQVNAQFARDLYASKTSMIFIGDSLNNARGAGNFVTYYEALIQTLPDDMSLCGFRVSGSTGNTGVNSYIKFAGGSMDHMVDGAVIELAPHVHVGISPHSPPGYRNEFRVVSGGSLPSTSRFAAVGLVNLPGIYPNSEFWIEDSTMVIRTRFATSPNNSILSSIAAAPITDHDGSAGLSTSAFEVGSLTDFQLATDRHGLDTIDIEFANPSTSRIGVQFSGDLDTNDSNESGRLVAWCDHVLFNKELAEADHGVFLDSISVGGYTARDHFFALDPEVLDDYFATSPRPFNTLIIWIGQNAETDEWNGTLQSSWGQRIESIGEMAIQASIDAGSSEPLIPILVTTPLSVGEYPSDRFSAMGGDLNEIASRRGWGYIDLHGLIGDSIQSIDPSYIFSIGPHPTQDGAQFIADYLYQYLNCIRADFNSDGERDFLDVSDFLNQFLLKEDSADLNGDEFFDFLDFSSFIISYSADCP